MVLVGEKGKGGVADGGVGREVASNCVAVRLLTGNLNMFPWKQFWGMSFS